MCENVVRGYLDVKISSKSRRGFTPWKAWQKQWCEIRRLEDIEAGMELKLKSSEEGNTLDCIVVPRSATLCRTESRSKQFAFGIFNLRGTKKAVLFLSGCNESDSQEWMNSIRKMLSIANFIPVGESNFRISLVDTKHSRSAGLLGLYGVLNANYQEIVINDPCTGAARIFWKWYHFHQFHLLATDDHIVVMHTSRDFSAGPGQLLLYCRQGPKLLHHLITRGQNARFSSNFLYNSKRFSRSEGDIYKNSNAMPDSPLCFRSQAGSDDSGVPHTNLEDNDCPRKSEAETNLVNMGMSEITKTPGGSETEDSYPDLQNLPELKRLNAIPRNESGISFSSGIYEEIPDDHVPLTNLKLETHIYENPFDLGLNKYYTAPPLPPRTHKDILSPVRCNTLPAKDLSKISQMFNFMPESEYVPMSPNGTLNISKKENFYVPMHSPMIQLENKMEEVYICMTNNAKTTV